METVKETLGKVGKWVWLVIAGVVIAFVAWKKHVQDEMAKHNAVEEQQIKDNAQTTLTVETGKVEVEKQKDLQQVDADKKQKEAELEAQKKAKVTKLKKGSSDELKKEAAKVLGVKEKKKGRPKKE